MITTTLFEKASFVQAVKDVVHNVLYPPLPEPPVPKKTSMLLTAPVKDIEVIPSSRDIPLVEKMACFERTMEHLKHVKLDQCQFVARFGQSKELLKFEDLYFTMAYKKTINETQFSRDAANVPIAYILSTVKVGSYVQAMRNNSPAVRYMLDPYNIFTLSKEQVKERYSKDPLYEEFMDALGKTAVR